MNNDGRLSQPGLHRRDFLKAALLLLGASSLDALAACAGKPTTSTSPTPAANTMTPVTPAANTTSLTVEEDPSVIRPASWSKLSHSNKAKPNYSVVFPPDMVTPMKITISAEDWTVMQANMTELFGSKGSGEGGGGAAPGGVPNAPGGVQPGEGIQPGAAPGGQGGGGDMTPVNPMWIPAAIDCGGLTWTRVGVRYKGNSSLTSGWRNGTLKLPLKFDFDQFEDEYPEIENQRFYGFKQLSLSNAFHDGTFMRDPIASAIFEEAGLPAAKTTYYNITLDYGQGALNLGLYVVIEVVDDTVVERFFGDDYGNIYEGDGTGVSLAAGTYNRIQTAFQKENNRQEADWSDIQALYNVLHSQKRLKDAAAWRNDLEALFDVDAFLEWLAISAVIQNWDNYGSMSHNFYLYHDPESGRLVWIGWDHNDVLGAVAGGPDGRSNVSLDKKDVGSNWPLIRFLLDEPVYYKKYVDFMAAAVTGPFTLQKIQAKSQGLSLLVSPYMTTAQARTTFNTAVQQLINNASARIQAAQAFLATVK